jgi:epoxyqueuosine reductase
MEKNQFSSFVKETALEAGFNFVGIAPAINNPEVLDNLTLWLNAGYQASMVYMERNMDKRADASKLVPGAKSVIVMLVSYYPQKIQDKLVPRVAKYAYGADYHEVLKARMQIVWDEIKKLAPNLDGRMFTDSAPLHEKSLANLAALGWIGKNSCLIHPKAGSFVFICEMVVNLELEYDQPYEKNYCGNCTRCIDACPTRAIIQPGVIDSRKCISFLTIENKEEMPLCFRDKFSNQLFGCDICQDVCPWNQKDPELNVFEEFAMNPALNQTTDEWMKMTKEEFNEKFSQSPLKRTGYDGIQRNMRFLQL